MNQTVLAETIGRALTGSTAFPEILATLGKEEVESYHVDFLRNEVRYYTNGGESFVTGVAFHHNGVAPEFSSEKIEAINRRVQAGQAGYADFVSEGAAAGCAFYIVYLKGKMVRYFGRDGGEHVQRFPGSQPANNSNGIARSAIKSADIQASPEKVYAFLADPMNWPQYAVVNLRSVTPGENGWFRAVTRFGEGEMKINGVKELGVFDHVWKDPQATWQVYSRVVPNGEGSTVMMTLFQPPAMSDGQFDRSMAEMDIEMARLKEILEQ